MSSISLDWPPLPPELASEIDVLCKETFAITDRLLMQSLLRGALRRLRDPRYPLRALRRLQDGMDFQSGEPTENIEVIRRIYEQASQGNFPSPRDLLERLPKKSPSDYTTVWMVLTDRLPRIDTVLSLEESARRNKS